jgi:hypothetical protein
VISPSSADSNSRDDWSQHEACTVPKTRFRSVSCGFVGGSGYAVGFFVPDAGVYDGVDTVMLKRLSMVFVIEHGSRWVHAPGDSVRSISPVSPVSSAWRSVDRAGG